MKNYSNPNIFKRVGIKPHQILICSTSDPDYEMTRKMLLTNVDGLEDGEYLFLEGYHCSCYDFDEADWEGTVYTEDELFKLAKADYNKEKTFWKQVLMQVK